MSQKPSGEDQAALRAALDAALDCLGEDDASDEDSDSSDALVEETNQQQLGVGENLDSADTVEEAVKESQAVAPGLAVSSDLFSEMTAPSVSEHEDAEAEPIILDAKHATVTSEDARTIDASTRQSKHQALDERGLQASISRQSEFSPDIHDVETPSSRHVDPSAEKATAPTSGGTGTTAAPFIGPPRPPPSSSTRTKKKVHSTDPDKLFMEMMEDMLLTEQEGVTGPDEMMMRLVQQLQEQLHELEKDDQHDDAAEQDEPGDSLAQSVNSKDLKESEQPDGGLAESSVASGYVTPFETEPAPEPVRVDVPPSSREPTQVEQQQSAPVPTVHEQPTVEAKEGGATLPKSQSQLSEPQKRKSKSSLKPSNGHAPGSSSSPVPDAQQDLDAAISQLLQGMAKQVSMDDGSGGPMDDSGGADGVPREADLLNMLMKGLRGIESGGDGDDDGNIPPDEDFNADAMIDGMMEQLLSKDLMYEPMKQVALRFPKWLEERRESMPEKEFQQRRQQCDCFQKLVHVYETRPGDAAQLMGLMQEVQEYGQPPAEIIREIAPGLELDASGLPKLNGSFPPLSGDGGDSDECTIM